MLEPSWSSINGHRRAPAVLCSEVERGLTSTSLHSEVKRLKMEAQPTSSVTLAGRVSRRQTQTVLH